MELCHDLKQVVVNTTAAGKSVTLSTASTGRVGCLNRLDVTLSTTASSATLRIVSTTSSTIDLNSTAATQHVGPMPFAANSGPSWPFCPLVEGAIRGKQGQFLRAGSTGSAIKGVAVASWTSIVAT